MSFATFLDDHLAMADFGDWLVVLTLTTEPVPGISPEVVNLYFSRHGTVTGSEPVTVGDDTLPAHTLFVKRLLTPPSWSQSLWSQGQLFSHSFPNYGRLVLNNRDGGLDQYRPGNGWVWANQPIKVYFGHGRQQAQQLPTTIGRTVSAVMGRPQFDLSTVTVPLLGHDSLFDQPTSQRVYRGTSYQLAAAAGSSTETFVAHGAANNGPNLTGDMTVEMWLWADAWGASGVNYWGWTAVTGNYPWLLQLSQAGVLSMIGCSGGVTYSATCSQTLDTHKPYHISATITGRDVRFQVFDEDAQTETTDLHTNVFPAGARDSVTNSLYRTLRTFDGASLWGDEYRVWNVARTADEVRADRSHPLTPPTSCVHYERYDDGTGTAVTDSSASGFTGTVTTGVGGSYAWLWAYEGTAELAGTPKPDLWGQRFGCKAVLVNPLENGYQVAAGSIEEITGIAAGGLDDYAYDGDAPSFFDFITYTVRNGHVLTYLPRGLFRLGAAPTLPLMVHGKGYNNGAMGYVNTAADIIWDAAQQRGPKLNPATAFDDDSRDDFNTDTANAVCGEWLESPVSMMEFNDLFARSGAGWWGYVRGSDLLHVERFKGPADTAAFTFDKRHIIDEPTEITWEPVGELIVRYQHSSMALTEDQLADAIREPVDAATAALKQRYMKEWLEEKRGEASSAKRTVTIDTALYYQADASALADYLWELLQGEKRGWAFVLKPVGLEMSMSDTATFNWADQFGGVRLGIDGTERYIALTVNDERAEGKVTVEVLS